MISLNVIYYIFFFQAEDGIRDGHVTGVQTCALPILVPGAIHSDLIRPGLPTATHSTSARPTRSSRLRVKRCATVTVAPASSSSRASGRPTMLEAPTIRAFFPLVSRL